jgi:hypothetical protein
VFVLLARWRDFLTRTGWSQAEFDADNSNFTGRITVDNYEVVDGQLIVR